MASNGQVQIDAAGAVGSVLRATVQSQPAPPRSMSIATLLMAMYTGKLVMMLAFAGLGAGLFVITFFQSGSTWSLWFLRFLWASGIAFTLVVPGRSLFRILRYGRDGLLARATVIEARVGVDRSNQPEVRGRRIVHHPVLGDF